VKFWMGHLVLTFSPTLLSLSCVMALSYFSDEINRRENGDGILSLTGLKETSKAKDSPHPISLNQHTQLGKETYSLTISLKLRTSFNSLINLKGIINNGLPSSIVV